ncbi:ArsA-related P-loop ATPase [Bdellovibrionota bacterium FG-2]
MTEGASPSTSDHHFSLFSDVRDRPLIFVSGKGGVGKTTMTQAMALAFANRGLRTLWFAFEDPLQPPGKLQRIQNNLWHFNCESNHAFEEYTSHRIGVPQLTRIFLRNKIVRYLSQASPGIRELMMIAKAWSDRTQYDRVVVDMPSTGYALAMFQSPRNFVRLFRTGPLHDDAEKMTLTFGDPRETGHIILSLPEEMPLQESLELETHLQALFPENAPAFVVNRILPTSSSPANADTPASAKLPSDWPTPYASSLEDFTRKRQTLENYNLRLWRDEKIKFESLPHLEATRENSFFTIVGRLAEVLQGRLL